MNNIIKCDDVHDVKFIEPDWKLAFQTLYGFCLGAGLGDKIKDCEELQQLITPKYMFRKSEDL